MGNKQPAKRKGEDLPKPATIKDTQKGEKEKDDRPPQAQEVYSPRPLPSSLSEEQLVAALKSRYAQGCYLTKAGNILMSIAHSKMDDPDADSLLDWREITLFGQQGSHRSSIAQRVVRSLLEIPPTIPSAKAVLESNNPQGASSPRRFPFAVRAMKDSPQADPKRHPKDFLSFLKGDILTISSKNENYWLGSKIQVGYVPDCSKCLYLPTAGLGAHRDVLRNKLQTKRTVLDLTEDPVLVRVWNKYTADKNYDWQISVNDGDLLLITDHLSDPGWWEGCVLRVGADMQTVQISEIGFVPGHPSFYSPVLLDKADITQLMASLQKKDRGYQELVGEFIKGHHNEEGESEEFKRARTKQRRMTLMENKERFLLPLVPLFSEQSQRHSQLNVIAVENNLNPSKGDLPFKAGDCFVLLNPWLNKLEKTRTKQGAMNKELKWMAKRFITGSMPADDSYYSLQFDEADDGPPALSREIARIIASVNTVISAFGHASTAMENDSPRFCKTISLRYDAKGSVVGAQFGAGDFERSRVTDCTLPGTNFRIFYDFALGASAETKNELLGDKQFKYLQRPATSHLTPKQHAENLKRVTEALGDLGCSEATISSIFKILAGILWVGDIEFGQLNDRHPSQITNQDCLEFASWLLELPHQFLGQSLLYSSIATNSRTTGYAVPHMPERCVWMRDNYAASMYERLFCWLVRCANGVLASIEGHTTPIPPDLDLPSFRQDNELSISVVDGYSLESHPYSSENRLRQLGNNLMFETLYQHAEISEQPLSATEILTPFQPPGILTIITDVASFPTVDKPRKIAEKITMHWPDNIIPHEGQTYVRLTHPIFDIIDYNITNAGEENSRFYPGEMAGCPGMSNNPLVLELYPDDMRNVKTAPPLYTRNLLKLRSNLRKELSSVPCHVIYTLNAANPSADESGYSPSANTFAEEFVTTQLAAFNIPARLKAPAIMMKNKPASVAKAFTSMSCAQFLSRYELVLKDILDTPSAGPSLVLPSEKLKVNLLPQEMLLTTFAFLRVSDLMTATQVCRLWQQLILDPQFLARYQFQQPPDWNPIDFTSSQYRKHCEILLGPLNERLAARQGQQCVTLKEGGQVHISSREALDYLERYLQLKKGEDFVARRLLLATNKLEQDDYQPTLSGKRSLFMRKMKVTADCRLSILFKQGVDVVVGDEVQIVAVHQVGLLASGWIAGRLIRNAFSSYFPLSLLELAEEL